MTVARVFSVAGQSGVIILTRPVHVRVASYGVEISHQMVSNGLRRWCVCQVKATDTVTRPESAERKPLEASSSSLSVVKEESVEIPVEEKDEVEPRSDRAEEKTEVESSDNPEEEKTTSTNEIEVKEGDQDEDKVMRHFSTMMFN